MDAGSWLYVIAVGLVAGMIVEFEKWVRLRTGRGT
jgi:hypothetical protein